MNTYNVPRNVKGEGRILFIFSTKALIYTAIGLGIGLIFYIGFTVSGMQIVGIIADAAVGLIGFLIGTFKIPDTRAFQFTQRTRWRKYR